MKRTNKSIAFGLAVSMMMSVGSTVAFGAASPFDYVTATESDSSTHGDADQLLNNGNYTITEKDDGTGLTITTTDDQKLVNYLSTDASKGSGFWVGIIFDLDYDSSTVYYYDSAEDETIEVALDDTELADIVNHGGKEGDTSQVLYWVNAKGSYFTEANNYTIGVGFSFTEGESAATNGNTIKWYTVTANPADINFSYEIADATADANGSIAITDDSGEITDIVAGKTVTVTSTPADDYELATLTVTGTSGDVTLNEPVDADNLVYTFTMPAEDVEITATFSKVSYYVTKFWNNDDLDAQPVLSIDGKTTNVAQSGDTVTVTGADGYEISEMKYAKNTTDSNDTAEGTTIVPDGGVYSFEMPAYEIDLAVTYVEVATYSITDDTVDAPTGYSIGFMTESGVTDEAAAGDKVTITYSKPSPNAYEIDTLTVTTATGADVAVNSGDFTFEMPAEAVTVVATFKLTDFDVTVTAPTEAEGTLATDLDGDTANYGNEITVTATAATGYRLVDITVTGKASDSKVTITDGKFIMPDEDVEITATFEAVYAVTVGSIGDGGSVAVDVTEAGAGDIVTVNVTPAMGYAIDTVTVTTAEITNTSNGVYTFTMPAEDVTVSATFIAVNNSELTVDGAIVTDSSAHPDAAKLINDGKYTVSTVKSTTQTNVYDITITADEILAYYTSTESPYTEGYWVGIIVDVDINGDDDALTDIFWGGSDKTFNSENTLSNDGVSGPTGHGGDTDTDETQFILWLNAADLTTTRYLADNYDGDDAIALNFHFVGEMGHALTLPTGVDKVDVTATPSADDNGLVAIGDEVTLDVVIEDGYTSVITASGVTLTEVDGGYTFVMPANDVVIYAGEATAINYTVSGDAVATNGAFSFTTDETANIGDVITFSATPNDGYKTSISVKTESGTSVSYAATEIENEYSFTMPADDVTITVSFYKPSTDSSDSSYGTLGGTPTTDTTTDETTGETEATTTVTPATTTTGGVTSTTVDSADIDTAITDAVDSVVDGGTANIEIAVSSASDATKVEVTLPADALDSIATSDVASLVITSDAGSVTIPSDLAAQIAAQTEGNVAIAVGTTETGDIEVSFTDDDGNTLSASGVAVTVPHEITDTQKAENVVVWATNEDGTLVEIEATFDDATGELTFETGEYATYSVGNNPFADVAVTDYSFLPIQWALENEITTGMSDDSFGSETAGAREQVATFLWRLAGQPSATNSTTNFTDLDSSAYYHDAVLWASSKGITTGMSDTTFGTGSTCTRGQIVTFLYRYAGEPTTDGSQNFSDLTGDEYYAAAVAWAVENGITTGMTTTSFGAEEECTREQIATFLYRFEQNIG